MNKELFSSMQRQLTPSPQARAELEERLAGASPKKRPAFRWQYGAAAACLLLAVAAVPLWRQFNPDLHAVVQGQGNAAQAYQEDSAVTGEGADALPKLNFWVTDLPSEGSSHSYAAPEGIDRDATQADLNALLGGSIPEVLGWEGFSELSGMLAFGIPTGADGIHHPLDELYFGHFYGNCTWGKFALMVGGLGFTVSPCAIGRPEDYPGDACTQIDGVEIRAARFTDWDGTAYGEVSFTLDSGYSVFYSVNTPSAAQTEELLSRLVQAAVVEDGLYPQALSPDSDTSVSGPAQTGDAVVPNPLPGVSGWRSQPWFGGYYYDNAAGRYVLVTVEGEAVPELAFGDTLLVTGTYSYAHLSELMDALNELTADPECGAVMAAWWIDEMENQVYLTITEENPRLLAVLAELDPAGDAILVMLGEQASTDDMEDIAAYDVLTGEETVGSVWGQPQPGGQPLEGAMAAEPAAPEQSMPAAADFPESPVSDWDISASSGAGLSSRG